MREIKFRAWDNKMCIIIEHNDMASQKSKMVFGTRATLDSILTNDDYNVMEYTGLKDKDGRDIYEGDICTKMISPDENNLAPKELHRGIIVYHYGGFCYKSGEHNYPMSRTHGVVNIIGNIYENPELL